MSTTSTEPRSTKRGRLGLVTAGLASAAACVALIVAQALSGWTLELSWIDATPAQGPTVGENILQVGVLLLGAAIGLWIALVAWARVETPNSEAR